MFYQTPPNPLDWLTWNFVGWYIKVLGRFSNRSHWFKLPLPLVNTGILGPIVHFSWSVGCRDFKFGQITYWGNEHTHIPVGLIGLSYLYHQLAPELWGLLCISPKVLVVETWNLVRLYIEAMSTLTHTHQHKHMVQVTFTTGFALTDVCVCVWRWTPPKLLDISSWNFVGWYNKELGRFSNRSHWFKLPLPPVSTGILEPIVHFSYSVGCRDLKFGRIRGLLISYKYRLLLCDISSRRALNLKALSLSDISRRLALQLKASSRCSKLGTFRHTIKVSCITQNTVNLWHTIKASSKIKSRRVILWDTIKANSITQSILTVTF